MGKLNTDIEGEKAIKKNKIEQFSFQKYFNDFIIKLKEKHKNNKPYMVTPCHHIFHSRCLEIWLELKNECPYCRAAIPPIEI